MRVDGKIYALKHDFDIWNKEMKQLKQLKGTKLLETKEIERTAKKMTFTVNKSDLKQQNEKRISKASCSKN